MSEVRVGLCGFSMAFDEYVDEFPLVEVQQTFYEPPRDATMRRWRALAPEAFEFTVKAWQLVTHEATSPTYRRLRRQLTGDERAGAGSFRMTPIVLDAWARTLECVRLLRATAVLLQCPASFTPTDEHIARIRGFALGVERPDRVRLLWEPRGPWPAGTVADLCRELELTHVVDPFVTSTVTPQRTYLRLHGNTGPRHVYTDDELRRLRDWLPRDGAEPAYVLFNNLPRVGDARRFRALVAGRTPGTAPLARARDPRGGH